MHQKLNPMILFYFIYILPTINQPSGLSIVDIKGVSLICYWNICESLAVCHLNITFFINYLEKLFYSTKLQIKVFVNLFIQEIKLFVTIQNINQGAVNSTQHLLFNLNIYKRMHTLLSQWTILELHGDLSLGKFKNIFRMIH